MPNALTKNTHGNNNNNKSGADNKSIGGTLFHIIGSFNLSFDTF